MARDEHETGDGVDTVDPRIQWERPPEGVSPLEAEGRFLGFAWQFHAVSDRWHFTLSTDLNLPPAVLELRGPKADEVPEGVFHYEQAYGVPGKFDAGYMAPEVAESFIREACDSAAKWLEHRDGSGPARVA